MLFVCWSQLSLDDGCGPGAAFRLDPIAQDDNKENIEKALEAYLNENEKGEWKK